MWLRPWMFVFTLGGAMVFAQEQIALGQKIKVLAQH